MNLDFADDISLVTDRDLCPIRAYNAKLMFYQTQKTTPEAENALADALPLLASEMTIFDWIYKAGCKTGGFAAALRLIAGGHAMLIRHERLSPLSEVISAGAIK